MIKEKRKGKPALTKWVGNGFSWHMTDLDFCTMEQISLAVGILKVEKVEDYGNGIELEWNMLQSGLGGTNCWWYVQFFYLKNLCRVYMKVRRIWWL